MPLLAKYIATVSPQLFYNSGLCSHSLVGIKPPTANLIATVLPLFVYINGLCYHYLSGILD